MIAFLKGAFVKKTPSYVFVDVALATRFKSVSIPTL
jgi:hypothetical protein